MSDDKFLIKTSSGDFFRLTMLNPLNASVDLI